MKTMLVTGGAGFIGSAFVRHLVPRQPRTRFVVFDRLTYAGNLHNLLPVSDEPNYAFARGDIADEAALARVFAEYEIDVVVNFAAESHVDRSILAPGAFVRTDVLGVFALLEASLAARVQRFVQVSTDEVYGDIEQGFSREGDAFLPNSPYSASKAGGELLARAYAVTHGLDVVITRGSNTYGPYQYPEKLLPFFATEALDGRPLPIYGDGRQVRDWLHVDDHVAGIVTALERGRRGEAYNIAAGQLHDNLEVTKRILAALGRPWQLARLVPDREGHDRRYAMDAGKLRALGWRPRHNFADGGCEATARWYAENEWWWRPLKGGDFQQFYQRQYAERLAAADAPNAG